MSDSDRKYRQRGYRDEPRDRGPKPGQSKEQTPRAPGRPLQDASGPRTPNLMASHEVLRCARCGNLLSLPVASDARCARCGVEFTPYPDAWNDAGFCSRKCGDDQRRR